MFTASATRLRLKNCGTVKVKSVSILCCPWGFPIHMIRFSIQRSFVLKRPFFVNLLISCPSTTITHDHMTLLFPSPKPLRLFLLFLSIKSHGGLKNSQIWKFCNFLPSRASITNSSRLCAEFICSYPYFISPDNNRIWNSSCHYSSIYDHLTFCCYSSIHSIAQWIFVG